VGVGSAGSLNASQRSESAGVPGAGAEAGAAAARGAPAGGTLREVQPIWKVIAAAKSAIKITRSMYLPPLGIALDRRADS